MTRLAALWIGVLALPAAAQPAQWKARVEPPAGLTLREISAAPVAVREAASLPDLAKALDASVAAAQGEPARLAPLLAAANQALAEPAPAGQGAAFARIRRLRDRLAKDEDVQAALEGFYDRVERAPAGNFVLVNSKGKPALLKAILGHPDFPSKATVFTNELSLGEAAWERSLGRVGLRRKLVSQARNLDSVLAPYRAVARDKDLKIWVGHPLLEDGKLYNAYSLVTKDGIAATQRKKFLWKTETWLFSEPKRWEGLFKDLGILICSEMTAFYSVEGWARPTKIPELRRAAPPLVVAAAWWVYNKRVLLDSARAVARPLWQKVYRRSGGGKPFTVYKGIHKKGVPVFVVNFTDSAIVTPTTKGSRFHTQVKTRLRSLGWIQVKDGRARVVSLSRR